MDSLVAGEFDGQGHHHTPKPYVRQAFRKSLECSIFAHGFARAWVVAIVGTTTLLPIPAKAVAFASRATRGAWRRRRRTWAAATPYSRQVQSRLEARDL